MNEDKCNNLKDDDKIKLANKLKISINNTKNICKLIIKKHNILYPCDNIISSETSIHFKKHQLEVSNHLSKSNGIIVYHQVGTWKTLTAISSSQCLLNTKIVNKIIVITPTSLQENFKEQLLKYNIDIDFTKYYFYTIQKIVNDIINKTVISCNNSLVIIDEAHNLRTLEGSRFKIIHEYCKNATKILLLTATPFINYTFDIINLVSLIKKEQPLTIDEFKNIKKDNKKLKEYLKDTFSLYFKNSDDINFPNKEIIDIYLKMSPEYLKIYNKIEKGEESKILFFKDKNIKVFYNGVRRVSNNINKLSPKNEWIINKILENKKSKFLIFSHFIDMGITPLMKLLDEYKINYLSVTGDLSIKERKNATDKYNNGDINILFISKAGAEGLNLKNTTFIILLEPSWNENEVEQIIGRGIRYKSHQSLNIIQRKVIVYKLYLIKPIEYDNLTKILDNTLLEWNDNILSIDLYLKNYSKLKQQDINSFYNLIHKYRL